MEVVEDDLFFADLSQRISLLIMDDDDPALHLPPVSFQAISQAIHPIHNHVPSFHEQNGRREIKGTGVFIPRSSSNNPRRSKQSRSKSSNTRLLQTHHQRHIIDDTSSGHYYSSHDQTNSYHNHNNTTNNPSYNSLNHKRCY